MYLSLFLEFYAKNYVITIGIAAIIFVVVALIYVAKEDPEKQYASEKPVQKAVGNEEALESAEEADEKPYEPIPANEEEAKAQEEEATPVAKKRKKAVKGKFNRTKRRFEVVSTTGFIDEDEEEKPAEEAPAEEAKTEEAPVEEAKVEEAPAEEAKVEEAPAEEAKAAEETPAEEAPAEAAVTEEAPAEEAKAAEETPAEEAPAEEAPAEEAKAAEETPAEEAPAEEAPAEEAVAEEAKAEEAPAEEAKSEEAPAEEAVAEEAPAEEAKAEEAPAEEAKSEEAPAEEAKSEEAPAEEAVAEEAPAEEAKAEEVPAEEAKAEEAPAEEDATSAMINAGDVKADKAKVIGKYEVFPVEGQDKFMFRLKASNGEVLITSELYTSRDGAKAAIETIERNLETGNLSISDDKNDKFQFKLTAANMRTLATSANYSSLQSAQSAMESFKRFAFDAKIVDLEVDDSPYGLKYFQITEAEDREGGKLIWSQDGLDFTYKVNAQNGQTLLESEIYKTKKGAQDNFEAVKDAIKNGTFFSKKDKTDRYQFVLYGASGRLVAIGETYASRTNAESAAQSLAETVNKAAED